MSKNYLTYSFPLILIAIVLAIILSRGLAYIPLKGYNVKVFDPISDFKIEDPIQNSPFHPDEDVIPTDSLFVSDIDSIPISQDSTQIDSVQVFILADAVSVDEIPHGLSDFSLDKSWSKKVSEMLRDNSGKVYRIAFLGDSFIEGDILVGPFRNKIQQKNGGRGVGFVPITSVTSKFRQTVRHDFNKAWKSYTPINRGGMPYSLSELVTLAGDEASVTYKMAKAPSNLTSVGKVGILYSASEETWVRGFINDSIQWEATLPVTPSGAHVQYIDVEGVNSISTFKLDVPMASSTIFHGVSLEGKSGFTVDNLSARGFTGLTLSGVDAAVCSSLQTQRPYDLLILSYGLNVVNPESPTDRYRWYRYSMEKSISHLKQIYPDIPIVIMSVSDRCTLIEGNIYTLPGVYHLMLSQFNLARSQGCMFWNTYDAMQQLGGMSALVSKGHAAKDYTHIGSQAGYNLANILLEDLLNGVMEAQSIEERESTPAEGEDL